MTRTVSVDRIRAIVSGFRAKRVLVIGDMVTDQYVVGSPARISREAPVLVLHHREEFVCPGGAANVASNLGALGAATSVAGVIGNDLAGARLRKSLQDLEIETTSLVVDTDRPTAMKTRIVARGEQEIQQQIVRIDRVETSALNSSTSSDLWAKIGDAIPTQDALIISDYENGVINEEILDNALPAARKGGLVIAVDSHGDLFRFKGVTVATPNQPEAESTLGRSIRTIGGLEEAGRELCTRMDAKGVLITRGSQGMSLFEQRRKPRHLPPANVREVFDPNGAGDTVCAVFTLALLAGGSMEEAAFLSNVAAGEVVKKLGAATITAEALEAAAHIGLGCSG